MKASELRKLIGKPVTWLDTWCPKRGYIKRDGILMQVQGRNALIDQQGSNDWKWIPDLYQLKAKERP